MIQGLDYSDARPSPSALYAAGYRFACRYLWHDTNAKGLSVSEAKALGRAGVAIVLNYESTANRAMGGYNAGVSDAQTARTLADAVGAPHDCVIYFSVDFQTEAGNIGPVVRYFEGVRKILGIERVGAYGSYFTVEALAGRGTVSHFWQTYAWSASRWSKYAHIRQTHNGYSFHGSDIDLDTAVITNYGGFIMGAPETTTPPAAPGALSAPWDAEAIPVHVGGVKKIWQAAGTIGAIFDRLTDLPSRFNAVEAKLDEILSQMAGSAAAPAVGSSQVSDGAPSGSLASANDVPAALPHGFIAQVDTAASSDLGSDGAAYPR